MNRTAYVYIGPDRPFGLPIKRNSILAGDPEEVFPDLWAPFKEHPNFRKLFVPVSGLAQARAALKQPGSALAAFCAEIRTASDNYKTASGRK